MVAQAMKRLICIMIVTALCVAFSGCGGRGKCYQPEEYILETDYTEDYRILQLSDIHLANKDNRKLQYEFLDLTIRDANADMIVLSGDSFTFADRRTAKELFAFLDSYGIPWTLTFGNHDEQCYFSIDWLTDRLNRYGSNCIFRDIQDDNVFGNANFVINLTENGMVREQIILMDSNRYNYGEYWGYDYLKQSQIDWYERIVRYTSEQQGETVPSVMFCHIPFPEFAIAMEEAKEGAECAVLEYGEMGERCSCPKVNSGFFDKLLELGSTKAVMVGHDHVNNSRIKYHGVYLCYGVNSTDRIYYDENMLGGQIIVIHDDGTLSFEHFYHSYSEVQDE